MSMNQGGSSGSASAWLRSMFAELNAPPKATQGRLALLGLAAIEPPDAVQQPVLLRCRTIDRTYTGLVFNPNGEGYRAVLLPFDSGGVRGTWAAWQGSRINLFSRDDRPEETEGDLGVLREGVIRAMTSAPVGSSFHEALAVLRFAEARVEQAPDPAEQASRYAGFVQRLETDLGEGRTEDLLQGFGGSEDERRRELRKRMTNVPVDIPAELARADGRFPGAPFDYIPSAVLSGRREFGLSLGQALAWYLVEDPDGPGFTHKKAAEMLGMAQRQEISTHIRRAREKLSPEGREGARGEAASDRMFESKDFLEVELDDRREQHGREE